MSKNLPYEYDASQIKGRAKDIIFPKTINEIKAIVAINPKITIRGGGTGLSGGAVPNNDIILDTSKLDKIIKLDKDRNIIEVESGIILDELNSYLSKYDLEFPVNPSSYQVCTIGGMIATDAVGSRALKYGSTSKNIRWIEIINAEGKLEKKGQTEISDYSGMEGITGIIVKASLNLIKKKKRTSTLIQVENSEELMKKVSELKMEPNICAIEFIGKIPSEKIGLPKKYHLVAEYESDEGELKKEKYNDLIKLRNRIGPILSQEGYNTMEDPKIPPHKIGAFLDWLEKNKIPSFGHVSVGVIHPSFKKEQEKIIPKMMKMVKSINGQISGEHGIGILKKQYVDPQDKKILNNIKKRTDPNYKFNSGKVI